MQAFYKKKGVRLPFIGKRYMNIVIRYLSNENSNMICKNVGLNNMLNNG